MSLFSGLLSALLVSACCCWMLVVAVAAEEAAVSKAVPPTTAPGPGQTAVRPPGNNTNSTETPGHKRSLGDFVDGAMIQRALYVLVGITLTGVLYFLIRAVRLKKPAPKKKYGLLSNYDDSVEMEGVESEEDDTLYEARALRR